MRWSFRKKQFPCRTVERFVTPYSARGDDQVVRLCAYAGRRKRQVTTQLAVSAKEPPQVLLLIAYWVPVCSASEVRVTVDPVLLVIVTVCPNWWSGLSGYRR